MIEGLVTLPQTGLSVFPICLGVADLGTKVSRDDSFRLLDAYVEAGGNFFDTAHCYAFWVEKGLGESERTLGEYLRTRGIGDEAVIATKGGHPDAGPDYRRPEAFLSTRVISADVQESLERLGRDYIDLYYLHRDDGKTQVGEILETLNWERLNGNVRYLGASNWRVKRLLAANEWAREHHVRGFVALQNQWSLGVPTWTEGPDPSIRFITDYALRRLRGTDIAVVPYSSTSNGFFATSGESGSAFRNDESYSRLRRAQVLAERYGFTPNQVALAFLRGHGLPVVPIIGTTDPEHLRDALGAIKLNLTEEDVRWLKSGHRN